MSGEQDRHVQLKAATQLANETMRASAVAEWHARREYMRASRGEDLTLPKVLEESATQAINARALAVLCDIAVHDPDPRWRTRAAELILQYDIERQKLQAGLDAKHPVVQAAQHAQVVDADVPREEKIRILRAIGKTG